MSLLNPWSLIWLAVAIPIVVFYILKIRLRRVPVSTIIFWRQIFEEKQPRSIWQKLRHLLSLLVQLALVCLLVFALAQPLFFWEGKEARRLILVIDNSASMRATDLAPTRLDRAKTEAARIIAGMRFRDEMSIVAAGAAPRVECGLTGRQRTLHDTVKAIEPSDGPTKVADAIAIARRSLAGHPAGKVIVISDGCFEGSEKLAAETDVEWVTIGSKTSNVGITRFQTRRSLLDPIGYEILVEVLNASDEPVECRLELELESEIVDVAPLKLAAGATWTHVFEKISATGGRLVAKLDASDALATDNQAIALLPKREMQPVSLVTDGNLFLEKVFEANPLVKLSVSKLVPTNVPAGSITVYHGKIPNPVPPGPFLAIDPANSCDLFDVQEPLQNAIVTRQDKDSPLMAHLRLDNVGMPGARKLTMKGPHRVLATALSGDPLFCSIDRPQGKGLVLTVNLEQGDLPLRTAFPILATNLLAWFSGNRGELRESLTTGDIAEVDLTEPMKKIGAAELFLSAPDRQARALPGDVFKTTIGPLDYVGVWSISAKPSAKDEPSLLYEVGCNLANRTESDLRPPESLLERAPSTTPVALARLGLAGRPTWFYLLVLGLVLAAVEWFLYQRRWIS